MEASTTEVVTGRVDCNIAPAIESISGNEFGGRGETEEVDYGPRAFADIHQKAIVNSFGDRGAVDDDGRHFLRQSAGVVGAMASTSASQGSGSPSSDAAASGAPVGRPVPSGGSDETSSQGRGDSGSGSEGDVSGRQPITQELIALLNEAELGHIQPNLKDWLQKSITESYNRGIEANPPSGILNVQTLEDYYDFVDQRVQDVPWESYSGAFLQTISEWHWPLSQNVPGYGTPEAPTIQENYHFAMWMTNWANAWGTFLNGKGSLGHVESFVNDPEFNIDEYIVPSGGFQSFNEFFAREVKSGERPVASLGDENVVVSPADSVPQGHWAISGDSTITTKDTVTSKGMTYSTQELLGDMSTDFAGGVFTHTFLNVFDYHRYRVPVSGKVVGIRQFVKNAAMTVEPGPGSYPENTLNPIDGTGFQFTQTRSMVIIDTAGFANVGLVIAMPMGMAMVSSCNITLTLGETVSKGDELGYFLFGGSDYVMMFQPQANFQIEPRIVDKHILACTAYGTVGGSASAMEVPEAKSSWSSQRRSTAGYG